MHWRIFWKLPVQQEKVSNKKEPLKVQKNKKDKKLHKKVENREYTMRNMCGILSFDMEK